MTHSFWWLLVDALATFRLTVLVTADAITDRWRDWIRRRGWTYDAGRPELPIPVPTMLGARFRALHTLVTCPWCISIWLAAGVVIVTRLVPDVWQYAAMALALSAVAGRLGAER